MHRSRSVDDGDDYSRGGTATEPRPRSEKGLTFQEDGAHKKKRKEKDKEGEGVERRRSSVFSFLSGGGSATSEDDNKSAGSLFSFGRRRTRTEGSISIAAASPFAEVPLPPLLLAGRYKDARQVLDHATAEAVRRHLPRRLREAVRWPLLYSMDMHGTSFSSFYLLVENKGPTVWAIEDEKGVLFGAFVSEDVRVVPDGRGFYGTGETWSEPGVGQVRMHQAAGLAGESFFVSTRRDCIVFGGGAAHVGLYLDRDFDGGYSDGRCTTFELEGTPLGSEAEDFAGFLGGRADFLVHTGGDENHLRQFTVRGIEVWGIDENFVRRSTDVPPEEITSDEARAMGLGFGRWVEGDDKFGEMKD
ncbi:TLD-domain-containing protein [Hyaloraphidium curvatum]|nr:TLD-domain-containing protein [Hyaloraphidium curvatum]